jgi:hypothetical protein
MALKIYPDEGISDPYSQAGVMTNAFRQAFDGRTETTRETKLYLRNDDAAKVYTGITIQPVSTSGRNVVDGTDSYGIKLNAGDTQPTADEWRSVSFGASISMSSILDISTYSPFWVRIEVPRGAPAESHEGLVFRVSAEEGDA